MWFWIIIILAIIAVTAQAFATQNANKEKEQSAADKKSVFIKNNNVNISAKYTFRSQDYGIFAEYILDKSNKSIYVSSSSDNYAKIRFENIIGCETIIDSNVTGRIGRAIAGSFIGGDAGAIVGAMTAKKKVKSFQIVIYKNDLAKPTYTYNLVKEEIKTDSIDFKQMNEFAQKINASIKAIISNNAENKRVVVDKSLNNNDSFQKARLVSTLSQIQVKKQAQNKDGSATVKEKLKEIKDLYDSDLITEKEYNEKKSEILKKI